MRRILSMAAGALAAAVLAHGLTCAAPGSATPPSGAYEAFFRSALALIEAHRSRLPQAWTLPGLVPIACPLIGFLLFRLLSSVRMGRHCWRPAAVMAAFLLAGPFPASEPWPAIGLTLLVFAVLICSVASARPAPAR